MKITIVIPAFNIENYICNTLESLINQTVKDYEIIIIDDGSTDNTYEVARNILDKANCLNFKIIKQKNQGVSSARNRGLIEASGEYILFLDGDDCVSNDIIKILESKIENNKFDIYCWKYDLLNGSKVKSPYFVKLKTNEKYMNSLEALQNITNGNIKIWTGSALYKREFLLENGLKYTEGCVNGEDLEFIYKSICRAKNIKFINQTLSYYVQREGSISNSYNLKRFDSVYAMDRVYTYMNTTGSDSLRKISNKIGYDKVIGNYLGNLNDAIRYLIRNESYSKLNIDDLFERINEMYPDIHIYIINRIKRYKGKNIRILVMSKIFMISRYIYVLLIKLTYNFREYRCE